jgi:hypothetical protein
MDAFEWASADIEEGAITPNTLADTVHLMGNIGIFSTYGSALTFRGRSDQTQPRFGGNE